uniref:Activating signal cointegrator 1 third domain-containing protein n=1 Tax=Fagus sylvatica TaxID=28930 RepID=A0A2N9J2B2_FAGSY
METAGQWLEKALVDLCQRIETGMGMDTDMISGLVSYCDLAHPQDAKEYLDNIIGQEAGKSVIEEYLQRRGHSDVSSSAPNVPTSKLQAYVKPRSDELSVSGTKKPKTPKVVSVPGAQVEPKKHMVSSSKENQVPSETSESRTMQKGNQVSSRKKKGKVISLAEAAKGSIVFQQGKPCSCQARRHKLEGSTYAGLDESLPLQSDTEAAAEAYAKRLVDYDRNSAARTTVIDDQSDYYEIEENSWLSKEEKELLRKKKEEIEKAEQATRNKVVVTFDLVGRKVLVNKDEASELESENRILRPPDERELNRIKPNPTLKVQPVFVNPGPSKKPDKGRQPNKVPTNGLCLEITGRVQHDSNELKYFTKDKQMETASSGKVWQVPSVNGGLHVKAENECSLDY